MSDITIYARTTGHKMVMGTNYPVEVVVRREESRYHGVRWVVFFDLCNGVPNRSAVYTTRRQALSVAAAEG